MPANTDTIVAISTAPGRAAIAIVRLSGPAALTVPNLASSPHAPNRTHLTHVLDEHDQPIDQVIVTHYRAPHSYTGEDVLELSLHGAPVLIQAVVQSCLARGARLAEPGEFTQRAFLNQRLDLAQAEAVRDLIDAHTLEQARIAQRQLSGSLARAIAPAKQALLNLIAQLEAGIDFAEDDLDLLPNAQISAALNEIRIPLQQLADTYSYGRILREGFTLALVGPPNAGKSSLFNALLGRDRAIVTAEPGTTRDTLAETTSIAGLPVTLIDTAGLRDTPTTEAETLGIARTHQAIADADLILQITPANTSTAIEQISPNNSNFIEVLKKPLSNQAIDHPTSIEVWTKTDLYPAPAGMLGTSAKSGRGIPELKDAITRHLGATQSSGELITSLRQHLALTETLDALGRAAAALDAAIPHEMLLLDLYAALSALDTLTGATPTEAVLHQIFSTFCIGK